MTVGTTVEKLGVIGSASTAGSVAIKSFEWKPVWVTTAARFFSRNTFDTGFDWATNVGRWVESVSMSVGVVIDLGSTDQKSEQVVNEDSFERASTCGTVAVWVLGLARAVPVWALALTGSVQGGFIKISTLKKSQIFSEQAILSRFEVIWGLSGSF